MELDRNLPRSEAHFLAITVRCNYDNGNGDATLFKLDDASFLPFSIVSEKFEDAKPTDIDLTAPDDEYTNPVMETNQIRKQKFEQGELGAALFVVVEL